VRTERTAELLLRPLCRLTGGFCCFGCHVDCLPFADPPALRPSPQFVRFLLTEFLDALLARDGLARTLARAGIAPRALAPRREAAAVTVAAVAADVAEARDVLLDRAAQRALDQHLLVEQPDDLRQLFFRQLLGAALGIDAGLLEDRQRVARADAVD